MLKLKKREVNLAGHYMYYLYDQVGIYLYYLVTFDLKVDFFYSCCQGRSITQTHLWSHCKAILAYGLMMSICLSVSCPYLVNFEVLEFVLQSSHTFLFGSLFSFALLLCNKTTQDA